MYVNGKQISIQNEISLSEFLKAEGYDALIVAVEKNGEIIPKRLFGNEMLCDSDKLEIVRFVGGG